MKKKRNIFLKKIEKIEKIEKIFDENVNFNKLFYRRNWYQERD
jgi:hypothetical protein